MIKKKLITYSRYFFEYLKHGDFISIVASVKYLVNKTSHSQDRTIKTTIGIFFCRKNTNDFQFANYKYEWGVKKYLLDNLHSYSVFIDGGACVGDYCVLLSRKNVRCFAFEPVPDNFNVLTKNLKLNNLDKDIKAYPFGLGATNEYTDFVFNPVNTGASHIAKNGEATGCKVEIRSFDSILNLLAIPREERILIKLDIEGMEPDAIRGAKNFILEYPNITFVIEDKHIGEESIRMALNEIASFEYGVVDEFNIFAKKINYQPSH
jgi:FkbM family methyltransferase